MLDILIIISSININTKYSIIILIHNVITKYLLAVQLQMSLDLTKSIRWFKWFY